MVEVGDTYDRALTFLLLRLRRRTRFFLHLALIFADVSRLSGHVSRSFESTQRRQLSSYRQQVVQLH